MNQPRAVTQTKSNFGLTLLHEISQDQEKELQVGDIGSEPHIPIVRSIAA